MVECQFKGVNIANAVYTVSMAFLLLYFKGESPSKSCGKQKGKRDRQ